MKTSTLKNVFGAGLFVLAGVLSASAQTNSVTPPVTSTSGNVTGLVAPQTVTYRITVPAAMFDKSDGTGLSIGTNVQLIGIKEVTELSQNGNMVFDVNIPQGTPMGGVVFLQANKQPFWHVTVADILGSTENNDDDVVLRPIGDSGTTAPGTGTTSPNSITQPAPTGGTSTTATASTPGGPQPKIDIFPNPASDQVFIVTEGEVLWGVSEVIDITGKKVLEVPTGASNPGAGIDKMGINISSLKPGTYFVRFRTNKDVYTKRILVVR